MICALTVWLLRRSALWLLVGAGVLLFVAANTHLVYVATISQPDCVAHLRQADEKSRSSGSFRAAISSCTSQ